jgi:hypothetical protein
VLGVPSTSTRSTGHVTGSSLFKLPLQKDGSRKDVKCPTIVTNYNDFSRGVDHADRLRQPYCVDRRSKKLWHRLFFGILEIACVNSYIHYKKIHPEKDSLRFRRGVSQELMSRNCTHLHKKRILALEAVHEVYQKIQK